MAKLPTVLPQWATEPYGRDELAWAEARTQCRRTLYSWAKAGKYQYYGDLVPLVNAIAWPEGPHTHEGRQMGFLLGQVSLAELDREEDRPLLSALVVLKDDNMPSKGFWDLLDELGVTIGKSADQRLTFWVREVQRCFAIYGKR